MSFTEVSYILETVQISCNLPLILVFVVLGQIFCKAQLCPGNKLGLKIGYKQGCRPYGFVLGKEGCVWRLKDLKDFMAIKQWSKVPFTIEKENIWPAIPCEYPFLRGIRNIVVLKPLFCSMAGRSKLQRPPDCYDKKIIHGRMWLWLPVNENALSVTYQLCIMDIIRLDLRTKFYACKYCLILWF